MIFLLVASMEEKWSINTEWSWPAIRSLAKHECEFYNTIPVQTNTDATSYVWFCFDLIFRFTSIPQKPIAHFVDKERRVLSLRIYSRMVKPMMCDWSYFACFLLSRSFSCSRNASCDLGCALLKTHNYFIKRMLYYANTHTHTQETNSFLLYIRIHHSVSYCVPKGNRIYIFCSS